MLHDQWALNHVISLKVCQWLSLLFRSLTAKHVVMIELWDILQKWIIEEGTDQQNESVARDQKVLTVEMKSDSSVNGVIEQLSWPQESWHCSHWRNLDGQPEDLHKVIIMT